MTKLVTACTLDCPDACSLWAEKGPEAELKVRGALDHPFTAGFTCAKIRNFSRRLRSPHRILQPLLKKGVSYQPLSWDDALDICAEKIQACRAEPSSILHIHGGGSKGALQLVPQFFFASLGSTATRGSLCDEAGIAACMADFGALESNDITDLLNSKFIVNWGKDLSRCSVHVAALVQKARRGGARVLSISPGGDGNGPFSDRLLRIRPGTDRFLAAAVLRFLLERGQIEAKVTGHASNWPLFRKLIEDRSVDSLVDACGVSRGDMEELCRFYSAPGPTATLIGWGLQRHVYGGENVRFINALALLSGNVGRPGGGSTFNISSMRNFNRAWATPSIPHPRRSLLLPAIGREILGAVEPPIMMIWSNGNNVVNQAPESHMTARAFEQVPFKVVVDGFMTDTAERADLILPCAFMLEKEDIVGSFLHNYVNYAGRVMDPPAEARSDFEILRELGGRLDPPVLVPPMEQCLREALASPYINVSLEELREKGHVRALRPEVAFVDLHFGHRDGKYRFPEALHAEPPLPPEFPLRLLTLIRKGSIHSQILPEDHDVCPTVWVSPDNPMLKMLGEDREVYLASPHGRMKVRIEKDAGLHPDVVIYRRGDWMKLGGGANRVTGTQLTDLGETAAFYSQHVRLEN